MASRVSHCLLPVVLAWALQTSSFSATITVPYDVPHNFNFMPQGDVLDGSWSWNVFASARSPLDRHSDSGTVPVNAPGVFGPKTVNATANGASSQANASLNVTNFVPNDVTGTVRSCGFASVDTNVPSAEAFASSTSTFRVRGGRLMKSGRIRWGPTMTATSHGQATAGVHDPISFDVIDLVSDAELSGTLLDILGELNGESTFAWSNGVFSVDASDFSFSIVMNSPYTLQNGTVDLRIAGGTVVTSSATGIFAGLFPAVGSPGTFTMPLPDLTLDYNLGDFGGDDLNTAFDFGNGGSAEVGVPESAAGVLAGVGLLLFSARKRTLSVHHSV
jgi:hypothetical protein